MRIFKVLGAGTLALLITMMAGGVWMAIMTINLATSPAIPWGVPLMALALWAMWQYLKGKGWPRSTSEARRQYLRANPVSRQTYIWSFIAGALGVVALAGYWIVMTQLVKMPGNVLPDASEYPMFTMALFMVMGSLVSPFAEEASFRGYCQSMLEKQFRSPVAVVISSIFFALAHLNQGFLWPKQLVYFLAGVAFGTIAYLTRSILPGIPVHMLGDITFFTLVWRFDPTRRVVWEGGADTWFWLHAAQAAVFTVLAVLAYCRLAEVARLSFSQGAAYATGGTAAAKVQLSQTTFLRS